MDRQLVWAGQVPLETDLLKSERQTYKALAWALQGVFGTSTFVTDLTVVPATPAALSVVANPGQILFMQQVDAGAYSTLTADSHLILKQGILEDAATLAITPPGSQSQIYLIQAGFQEVDDESVVLPYYNPANPLVAFSGPGGGGGASFRVRRNKMLVSAKPGVVAASPVAPAPDAGYVGLYTVTVAAGATTITAGNIAKLASAPMLALNGQLPLIPTGVQNSDWCYGVDSGTANSIVVNDILPRPSAYKAGQRFLVKIAATNTGATTVNVMGSGGALLGAQAVRLPDGSALVSGNLLAGQVAPLVYDGVNFQIEGGAQGMGRSSAWAVLAHTETNNTEGGVAPATDAWFTRKLNTKLADTKSIVTLASNQFTLPAGTYEIDVRASLYGTARCRSRLYNVTAGAVVQYSTNGNPISVNTSGFVTRDAPDLVARVTIAVSTTFRVEQIVNEGSGRSYTLGRQDGYGTQEIYAQVFIREVI